MAGIAGVNPNEASVASTAWAKFVVDVISRIKSMRDKFQKVGLPVTSRWDVRGRMESRTNHSIPMVFNRFISSMLHSPIGLSG